MSSSIAGTETRLVAGAPQAQETAAEPQPRRRRTRRAEKRPPEPETLPSTPERYIARIGYASDQEVPGPIDPAELLVHAHRDKHPVEVLAAFLASRLLGITRNEKAVRGGLRFLNRVGTSVARNLGSVVGSAEVERRAKKLLGVADRDYYFRFREATQHSEREVRTRIEKLQRDARAALRG